MKTKARRVQRRRTPPSHVDRPDWGWSKNGKPVPAILADIVKAVVRTAEPEKIVLFGSAAREEMGPDSDYDLLVIKGGKFNHWRVLDDIYENLRDVEAPVDVVLATPEVIERYGNSFCLVYYPALREGKVLYAA